ncbi:hypothetical protein ACWEQ7_18345 [Streptomyces sp. NPDC004069]
MALLSIFAVAAMTLGMASPASAATKKVCAPKKCVAVDTSNRKKYCNPGSGCGKNWYREYSGYCSSSVGCVSYNGKNYLFVGGPNLTNQQKRAAASCAAALGWCVFTAASSGGTLIFLGGVAITAWGCVGG